MFRIKVGINWKQEDKDVTTFSVLFYIYLKNVDVLICCHFIMQDKFHG